MFLLQLISFIYLIDYKKLNQKLWCTKSILSRCSIIFYVNN